MKVGIGLPNQVRGVQPMVIPGWAAQAEEAGFSTLGSVGRVAYPGSIGLLSTVLLGPAWPPVLLAKETAGIDAVSGGRLTLNGTPFKSPVWRMVGVRVGRQVFDDGCVISERTLVTIGDYCTLNAGSIVQCHSMEDGIFKSDFTVLEDGCTLGTGALVHYGVTMGEGAQLQPDSFPMKGEKVPSRARWGGNPARTMR